MDTPSGLKDSIPAWIKFSVQAPGEIPYNGIYYDPPEEVCFAMFSPSLFGLDSSKMQDFWLRSANNILGISNE
jgi:hypothetical protein